MKRYLLITAFIFGFVLFVKADTIDYWHVFYNNIKLKEFNQYSNGLIRLNFADIKSKDSLKIYYFHDAPCSFCENMLIIENSEHKTILYTGLNEYQAIIPINTLFDAMPTKEKRIFYFFYQKDPTKYPLMKILLFRVEIS